MGAVDKIIKAFIAICVLALILMIGGCVYSDSKMTPEEKAASSAQLQQRIDEDIKNRTYRYEVVSAFQYVQNQTNRYGGVVGSDVVIGFSYIASDGTIKTDDHYYGEVVLSNKDEYVVCESAYNLYNQLYLTKEIMSKMQTNSVQ